MIKFFCTILVVLCLGLPMTALCDQEEIAHFELSLASYQVGMTLDEASMIRAFHYFNTRPSIDSDGPPITTGRVDKIFLHDVEFSILVDFYQDRIKRIIGYFPAEKFDAIKGLLLQTLGPAEDRSKIARRVDNSEQKTIHFAWTYPTVKVSLVAPTGNIDHGTIAIQGNPEGLQDAPEN
jgi:hypothetical protein